MSGLSAGTTQTLHTYLKQGGVLHSDGPTKAHILNTQFGFVFAHPEDAYIPVLPGPSFLNIGELIINVQGTTKLLLNVKPHKAHHMSPHAGTP